MQELETRLAYTFSNKELLKEALTHPALSEKNYERLEFLGDAVLGLIIADALFKTYPQEDEGFMARARSALTRGSFLVEIAKGLKLSDYIQTTDAERRSGGHTRSSTLEDAMEAVIGGIYLESGYEVCQKTVLHWYGDLQQAVKASAHHFNPKGQLQEWCQEKYAENKIAYETLSADGPDHDKRFEVKVSLDGQVLGIGSGSSKKEAEENAALKAVKNLPGA